MLRLEFRVKMNAEQASQFPEIVAEMGPSQTEDFSVIVGVNGLKDSRDRLAAVNMMREAGCDVTMVNAELDEIEVAVEELAEVVSTLRRAFAPA